MAGGFSVTATGLQEAQRSMAERMTRLRDLSPAMKVIAQEIELQTDTAFRESKSPFGEAWPPLAPSTLLKRAAKLPGHNRRSKKTGKLTKGAKLKQAGSIYAHQMGGGVFKPLVDTGRARNSQHASAESQGVNWSAVGYLGPHITGGVRGGKLGHPPKRNPSVFQVKDKSFVPIPAILSYLLRTVGKYVQTGRVA